MEVMLIGLLYSTVISVLQNRYGVINPPSTISDNRQCCHIFHSPTDTDVDCWHCMPRTWNLVGVLVLSNAAD